MPLLLLLALTAHAQDAHGPVPPPSTGAVTSPVTLADPRLVGQGAVSAGVTFEYVDRPLASFVYEGGKVVAVHPLLDDVVAADVGAVYGISPRLAAGLTMPVFLSATGSDGAGGPAPGDLHLFLPLGLVVPRGDLGLAASLVPAFDLPTGASDRDLGDRSPSGGVTAAAGWRSRHLLLDGQLGGWWQPTGVYSFGTVKGGPFVRAGASAGYALSDHLAARAELLLRAPLYDAGQRDTIGAPSELLVTVRGHQESGLWWVASAGPGLTGGIGAANWRAFAGVGWSVPPPHRDEVVPTGTGVAVRVVDPDGHVVRDAQVVYEHQPLARTDADGAATLPIGVKFRRGVEISAPGFVDATVPEPAVGQQDVTVTLAWAPVPLYLRITDEQGRALKADVTMTSADPTASGAAPAPTVLQDGQYSVVLPRGTWKVDIAAPGMGSQSREVVVPPGRKDALYATAVLYPDQGGKAQMELSVTDLAGDAVEGAEIRIDGKPVGTTSTGGSVTVAAIPEGVHQLKVVSDVLENLQKNDVKLAPGAQEVGVALPWRDGSVRVVAQGPDGAVVDAIARWQGPARLPPEPLGEDGKRTFVLTPGTWELLLSSPTLGVQEREVVVPEKSDGVIDVEVVMQRAETGPAELLVRVVDVDGQPVPGAEVDVDGKSYGTTSTGGTLKLVDLAPGPRKLSAKGANLVPLGDQPIQLVDGYQEQLLTVAWKPGTLRIAAHTVDGDAVDALVRMAGPSQVPSTHLGPSGEAWVVVAPGEWEVLASSEQHGTQMREVAVPKASRTPTLVDLVMTDAAVGKAELDLVVTGPDGPIVGAEARLDGVTLGHTGDGGALDAKGLAGGAHQLEIRAEPYTPLTASVRLSSTGATKEPISLDWAPGAVKVKVHAGDAPVGDAIVRLAGPDVLRPVAVAPDGTRLFALSPGSWEALVSSPTQGLAQEDFDVDAKAKGCQVVDFEMKPAVASEGVLLVRVADEDGQPVVGADVTIAGQPRGKTSAGGALLVPGLPPGKATVAVAAAGYEAASPADVDVAEGQQTRFVTLHTVRVPVDVIVRDEYGKPLDAQVQVQGPSPVDPLTIGDDGIETVGLRPGAWQLLATAPDHGVKRSKLVIQPGQKDARVLFDLEPAKIRIADGSVKFLEDVRFGLDEAQLDPAQIRVLTEVADTLLARQDVVRVEIQGHTDATGSIAYNMDLSERRAETVRQALIAMGVPPERLVSRGYGPLRPIADNTTPEGQAKNRRVEFVILEASSP